jgi:anti-sigma factor RsiW
MRRCLDEGTLQAYLDYELPEANRGGVADHLANCPACRHALERVQATGARVSALLDSLVVDDMPTACPALPPLRARAAGVPVRWAGAALAGALAAGAMWIVVSARVPRAPALQPVASIQTVTPPAPAAGISLHPAAVRPKIVHARRRTPQPRLDDFIALDNDPIQVGVVVRVTLPRSEFAEAADVVIGEDGRARAIRFVQ